MKKFFCVAMVLPILAVAHLVSAADQEQKREDLVAEELNKYEHRILTYDASSLSTMDKAFLRRMLAAARFVEELNMLEISPKNLDYRVEIQKEGTENDKILFHRNQGPWCLDIDDPLCNALKTLPAKKIGFGFWPENMTEEVLVELEKQKNAKDLLSPFTFVVEEKQKYKAVPFASHSLIAKRMERLANELRAAVEFTDEPTLKQFLLSRAQAFETKTAFPYDASDYDWIALEGPWEVTVGPYETYKEPMKKKAQFEMYVAREDPKVAGQLAVYKDHLQEFENHFADFIGKDFYKARKLDPRIQIRAVELVYAAGDARNPHGAIAAYHLPNRGRSVDEGLYKKVILLNHMRLFTPLMQKRAQLALVKEQSLLVDEWADVMNTTFHEFAHGFGAHEELPILVDGKKTTVSKALGPTETLMEELKADVASVWFIPYLVEMGLMKKEDVEKSYTMAVMHLFGLLQNSLKGTYPQMAAVEVGNLMEKGALTFDGSRFKIHFDRMPDVINTLMKEIVTIQVTGDKAAAEALLGRYLKKLAEEKFEFQPLLQKPLATLKAAFDKAKLKSFAIDYKVTGI